MALSTRPLRVGLSSDFRSDAGPTSWGDIGLDLLTRAGASWEFLPPDDGALCADDIDGLDAVLFAGPAVSAESVAGSHPPPILARFGVGLDAVDVPACTRAGVAVTITPDGARRAVATAALTMMLALRMNLLPKDSLVRRGRWQDRMNYQGLGLSKATVGSIGLGNIAREIFHLLGPFDTTNLASDPHHPHSRVPSVKLVDLDQLLAESDVVVVTASLTPETHHLLGARELALLRPEAVLINVARGPIIDTEALVDALRGGRLSGAGLDVFETEPLPVDHPLIGLSNVVLSPHSLAWTGEMAGGNGRSAIRAILDFHRGIRPEYLVNPEVLTDRT